MLSDAADMNNEQHDFTQFLPHTNSIRCT